MSMNGTCEYFCILYFNLKIFGVLCNIYIYFNIICVYTKSRCKISKGYPLISWIWEDIKETDDE